jgi:ATP-dependent helicase YprA (DUF1998 family)
MNAFNVLDDVQRRTAEAILAQSGLSHGGLRRHLRSLFIGKDVSAGALLQQPVVEGAHPFILADETLAALSGKLLNRRFVQALDGLDPDHDYRFPQTRKPFRHQLEAWQLLLAPDPKSVVVTSGTGSGKTECFLFPILSDLATQAYSRRDPLEGVQAIMLYPLNALIESQQERLSAWTRPFRGSIRYGLYNGDMEKSEKEERRRQTPEQVIDREQLRSSPPPLLVTNVTMLEYMLVRAEDQPIIDASCGKLKWIVLDEAHSLVGAAAAEIALLLRRTMLAFGVGPEDVRFVATSATIGSGTETRTQLQNFLADVAGIPADRVHVVQGDRQLPTRPSQTPTGPVDLDSASPALLYDALGGNALTWNLVERLFRGSVPLADFAPAAAPLGASAPQLVAALSRASRTLPNGETERLAPVRVHAFERAVPGLWSCINPNCSVRIPDWPFGAVLAERADQCPHCAAPVLELISCTACGEVYLEGIETGTRLSAPLRNPPRDEFAFDGGREVEADDSEGDDGSPDAKPTELSQDHLFAVAPTVDARPFWIEPREDGWRVLDGATEKSLTLRAERHGGYSACPHCKPAGGRRDILRPVRFGAPFILGNAAPILLEAVAPADGTPDEKLPAGGRRLLSFTDSRQGTARMAAKLQTESERNFVRSFIYHQVQASMRPSLHGAGAEQISAKIRDLEKAYAATPLPTIADLLADEKRKLAAATSGTTEGIAWRDLAERLAARPEVAQWMLPVWQARDEEFFSDASALAEFLLLREFARRPRCANSVETLGLAQLRSPSIDRLSSSALPSAFHRRGKSLSDWQAYLRAVLTWFVRANGAIAITWRMQHWIAPKARLTSLVGPTHQTDGDTSLRAWPNGYFRANPKSRPVALLLQGLGLRLDANEDRTDLDECLEAAWRHVQATFSNDPERKRLDFSKTFVAPLVDAFWCPVTRRIVDCAPFGLTPYGLDETVEERRVASPIRMPTHPAPKLGDIDAAEAERLIQGWLTAPEVQELRDRGAWSNISDRIALFSDYARSAEHSAQQQSGRLRLYEREFKAGRINILNCSTTMEMGVDIGSVSSVMMTNVPPSIANYRQRVGRAGRRGQSLAMAFTFCRDRPLDREAFADPAAFLQRSISAPRVTLSSRPIVQRHVNAFLLGRFLRERAGDALKMKLGPFFGCPDDLKLARPPRAERPVAAFRDWLGLPSTAEGTEDAIARLTRRSVLEENKGLIDDAIVSITQVEDRFVAEWTGLTTLAQEEKLREAAKSRMIIEVRRLCGEFLLGGLADRGFLPGHGFPTDVVSFMPGKEFTLPEGLPLDGNRQFRTVGPQRSLDIAIRDYAPGSEIVLDGLVHRSAGVTLNWKRPASEANIAEIQSIRRHWLCLDCRESDVGQVPELCPSCGSEHLRTTEFLRPAGFSVDPRVPAHAETDILSYVAAEDPVVSTRGAQWKALPLPELGRYRSTREGLVFYSNTGGEGKDGFEVCLECGRAEAHDQLASGSALADHKPLRIRLGVDRCPGNDRPFATKLVALGMEITTDVFELQLRKKLSRPGAHALVIALREALAQELGIDADEMGFAVDVGRSAFGADAVSLFLFDRATGGGGFAVSLDHLLRPVLQRASRILDCTNPGCIHACAACVLTADAPSGQGDLDRRAALDYVREHLQLPAGLNPEDMFVDGAELSLSIGDEIQQQLNRAPGGTLSLFLPSGQQAELATDWPLSHHFRGWVRAGHRVELVVSEDCLESLSAADKLALRDFALRTDAALALGRPPAFPNGAVALAMMRRSGAHRHVWVARETAPRAAGASWGQPDQLPIAHGSVPISPAYVPIDLDGLLPRAEAAYRTITNELDSDLATFGAKAADLIAQLVAACGINLADKVVAVTYQDPFVTSPLAARLLLDTVANLRKRSGEGRWPLVIETRSPRSEATRSPPWQVTHDWLDGGDQKDTVEALGMALDTDVSLHHGDVPHGRYLRLRMRDGALVTIVLDQGFGAWMPKRGMTVRHNFTSGPAEQAKRLATLNVLLERRGVGATYVVVTATENANA